MPVDWAQRILLGTGIEREGEGFFFRPGWRSPDDRERDLLVPDPSHPSARGQLQDYLCLFQLPQHLLLAWLRLLERAQQAGLSRLEGFDAFVVDVARFLTFKELPAPQGAIFDLLVSQPGLRSIGWPRLWGAINLGDEATSLLFVNLTAQDLVAELRQRDPDLSLPATRGELAERFLKLCPDYPLVRLRIEPGEGFRLPAGGLIVAGCTLDKNEPDVLLLVRHGGEES